MTMIREAGMGGDEVERMTCEALKENENDRAWMRD